MPLSNYQFNTSQKLTQNAGLNLGAGETFKRHSIQDRHNDHYGCSARIRPRTTKVTVVAGTGFEPVKVSRRITSPLKPPEVIKRIEGKPIATRRILAPEPRLDDDEDASLPRR